MEDYDQIYKFMNYQYMKVVKLVSQGEIIRRGFLGQILVFNYWLRNK